MRAVCRPALGLVIGLLAVAGCDGRSDRTPATPPGAHTAPGAASSVPPLEEGPPPWPLTDRQVDRIGAAGLPALSAEAVQVHYHAHLDVIVDGRSVPVPAGIGIDQSARKISPLHTHDGTGVVHVESPAQGRFNLGQLFTEWGVRLTDGCLGGLCAGSGKSLRAYADGRQLPGDPRAVVLAPHQEVALVYGDTAVAPPVPASYAFAQGL